MFVYLWSSFGAVADAKGVWLYAFSDFIHCFQQAPFYLTDKQMCACINIPALKVS